MEKRLGGRLRICFFFSSRRRHTRFDCDWSSDVCSSDLGDEPRVCRATRIEARHQTRGAWRHEGSARGSLKRRIARIRGKTGREDRNERRRSEEHTSELQSQSNLVCRLLLEKKESLH